jgi:hypothetical protein
MIAQPASSSDFETSIAAARAHGVSLFARHADRPRQLRAWPRRQSGGRRTDPQARCPRDPLKPSGSWPLTGDAHNG